MESTPASKTVTVVSTEDALRASEHRFRMLADNISQFAWTADEKGWIFWYNRRWYEYTGTTLEEMQGWGWKQVHHPDHVDRVVKRVQRSWDTGEPWEDTFPLRGKDGQYRWFLSRALPIRDEAGNILCWFGTNTDVDDQVRAEESLREAHRRKDEFLAMLAHELRNPLAAIRNAVQVLVQSGTAAADSASASAVEILDRQVAHMARHVDDLLDVSRITRGKIEVRQERIDLISVVTHAVESTRPLCDSLGHELIVQLPSGRIDVHGDSIRLVQVIGNLLNNACKFTDGCGTIWLSVERDGGHALISVRDTGIGLATDELHRIFEIFAQVDRSLERATDGLGLGLALAKTLVELHGGAIEARSAGLGHGSEFIVRLPVVRDAPAEIAVPTPTGRTESPARRVLVVDDNRDSANTLAMLLKLLGHEVDTAHDGLEAVEKAGSFAADVILLDIGMPRLNGYEAARLLRKQDARPDLKLVALTGWGQAEDRRRSEEAGFDAHFVKPVDVEVLTRLFAEWNDAE